MYEISVRFQESFREYSYWTTDNTITAGDEVVVLTPSGPKVVIVLNANAQTGRATKGIICKLDFAKYAAEQLNIAALLSLDEKIKARFESASKAAMYKLAAKEDSELAALLEQKARLVNNS